VESRRFGEDLFITARVVRPTSGWVWRIPLDDRRLSRRWLPQGEPWVAITLRFSRWENPPDDCWFTESFRL